MPHPDLFLEDDNPIPPIPATDIIPAIQLLLRLTRGATVEWSIDEGSRLILNDRMSITGAEADLLTRLHLGETFKP